MPYPSPGTSTRKQRYVTIIIFPVLLADSGAGWGKGRVCGLPSDQHVTSLFTLLHQAKPSGYFLRGFACATGRALQPLQGSWQKWLPERHALTEGSPERVLSRWRCDGVQLGLALSTTSPRVPVGARGHLLAPAMGLPSPEREQLWPLSSQSMCCLNRTSQHPVTYFKVEQPPGELWFDLSSELWVLLQVCRYRKLPQLVPNCLSHSGFWKKGLFSFQVQGKQVKAWSQLSSKGISHWLVAGVKAREFSFENFITAWIFFKNLEWFPSVF